MDKSIKIAIVVTVLFLVLGITVIFNNTNITYGVSVPNDNIEFTKNIRFTKCEPINAVNIDTENIICEIMSDNTIELEVPVMSKPGSLVTLEYYVNNTNKESDAINTNLNCEVLHTDGSKLRDTETRYINVTSDDKVIPIGNTTGNFVVSMARAYRGDEDLKYKVSCSIEVVNDYK